MRVLNKTLVCAVLAGVLCAQAVSMPAVSYAAYAVQDDALREVTKDVLNEDKGIHKDTTSIDKSTKSIDSTTQTILDYVIRIWRQGEQEARSFEDTENDQISIGGFGSKSNNDLTKKGFNSLISGLLGGNVNISYNDVLKPLSDKDKFLFGKLQDIFGGSRTPWENFKNEMKDQLTTELQKMMKQSTKHPDVFPELSQEDIAGLMNGNKDSSDKIDTFWKDKFPTIVDKVVNKDPEAVRMIESEAISQIRNNMSKTRKKTTEARLVLMDKMKESQERTQKLLEAMQHAEGQQQMDDIKARLSAENTYMMGIIAQQNANYQQLQAEEAQARDDISTNEKAASDAVVDSIPKNVTSKYADEAYEYSKEHFKPIKFDDTN